MSRWRTVVIAAGLLATALVVAAGKAEASRAQTAPWCAQQPDWPYADCSYYTLQQCRDFVSGLAQLCLPNPAAVEFRPKPVRRMRAAPPR